MAKFLQYLAAGVKPGEPEFLPALKELLPKDLQQDPGFWAWCEALSPNAVVHTSQVLADGWPTAPAFQETKIMTLPAGERLAIFMGLLPGLAQSYQAEAWPDDILRATLSDLWLRLQLFREKEGAWGLTADDGQWLLRHFTGHLFKLGVLQFERTTWEFQVPYYDLTCQNEPIKSGTPILSVHIMEGEDLAPGKLDAAFSWAEAFFPKYFPQEAFQAFACYSWLLYPKLLEQLGPRSRIRALGTYFEVVGVSQDPSMAKERLLLAAPAGKAGSSLQRLAKKKPEIMGVGLGYRPLKEEEDWQN